MKKISIVSCFYNNKNNVRILYDRIKNATEKYLSKYYIEIIFIDNASTDFTDEEMRKIASNDRSFKAIFNTRNFGQIKASYYALTQARGDAVVYLSSDLQDPPELIADFIDNWENGCEVVIGRMFRKNSIKISDNLRKFYYYALNMVKDEGSRLVDNYNGFGLYDKKVISKIMSSEDPYPYFRGAVLDLGYSMRVIDYEQPNEKNIKEKQSFMSQWNKGMLGITRTTKVPIHFITILGFFGTIITLALIILSLICYVGYINFWIPKKMLSLYFLIFLQIFSIGLVGEYVIMLCRFAEKKPLVIEKERLNF